MTIGEASKDEGAWAGKRILSVDGRQAFELSFWCGTCPFLFERMHGANQTVSLEDLQERLNSGLTAIAEDVLAPFADLLQSGSYLPLLLEIGPTLVYPMQPGDYFAEEQAATWGVNGFWGLPEHPNAVLPR